MYDANDTQPAPGGEFPLTGSAGVRKDLPNGVRKDLPDGVGRDSQ